MEARMERQNKQYSSSQKAQAVLAVWTERRKPLEICRELGISWTILNQWQKRAMEGVLQALEPHVNLERGAALSPRLQALLARRPIVDVEKKLSRRLARKAERKQEPLENPE